MGKYIEMAKRNRAVANLKESSFFAAKGMKLRTAEGELNVDQGEELNLGADENDNLVVREVNTVLVVNDEKLAEALLNNVICKKQMSEVKHTVQPLNRLTESLVGANIDNRVKSTVDNAMNGFTQSTIEKNMDLSPAFKAKTIAGNKMSSKNGKLVEAITIFEDDDDEIEVDNLQVYNDNAPVNVDNEADFVNNVNNMGGDVVANMNTEAFDAANTLIGKVNVEFIGAFNKETGEGVIFPDKKFNNVEDLAAAIENSANKINPVNDFDWEDDATDENYNGVEECLREFVECGNCDEETVKKLNDKLASFGLTPDQVNEVILSVKK